MVKFLKFEAKSREFLNNSTENAFGHRYIIL